MPHLGGPLPFLYQRVDDLHAGRFGQAQDVEPPPEQRPSARYRQLYFDTVNDHPPALRCACETFGADRLLLGTDYPYLLGPRWRRLVGYVKDAGFSPADTAAILGGNAQTLLGIADRCARRELPVSLFPLGDGRGEGASSVPTPVGADSWSPSPPGSYALPTSRVRY